LGLALFFSTRRLKATRLNPLVKAAETEPARNGVDRDAELGDVAVAFEDGVDVEESRPSDNLTALFGGR
jgi:hypothetical protein